MIHFYDKVYQAYAVNVFVQGMLESGIGLYDGPDIKLFILVDWGRSLSVAWPTGFHLLWISVSYSAIY